MLLHTIPRLVRSAVALSAAYTLVSGACYWVVPGVCKSMRRLVIASAAATASAGSRSACACLRLLFGGRRRKFISRAAYGIAPWREVASGAIQPQCGWAISLRLQAVVELGTRRRSKYVFESLSPPIFTLTPDCEMRDYAPLPPAVASHWFSLTYPCVTPSNQ